MLRISDFISEWPGTLPVDMAPWKVTASLRDIVMQLIPALGAEYVVDRGIAIHQTTTVEEGVIFKAPVIIGPGCFVAAHAYLRGGVYLGEAVTIGPGCEIKSSVILAHSAVAHFNFIGDSIIGSGVNIEAGAIIANHHNDKADKEISIYHNGTIMRTGSTKFGAVVGDHCKIGANAVLSPGTVLVARSVVKRLELIDQSAI